MINKKQPRKSEYLTIRITKEMRRALDERAIAENRTLINTVFTILQKVLAEKL